MILAFCVHGDDESLPLDKRFGRSDKFCLVDSTSGDYINVIGNPMKEASGSAGTGAVQLLADNHAEGIVAPHLGPKAEEARQGLGMPLWDQGDCKTVEDAFESWKIGDLKQMPEVKPRNGLYRA